MRELFSIDNKDYDLNGRILNRPSSRAIIIKNNKVYMVHSLKYDYYKFPGGGIEKGENSIEALIRETKEEAGLIVIEDSIKPFGIVKRIQKYDSSEYDVFIQDNFYYLCDVKEELLSQDLDEYESDEKFTLELVDDQLARDVNINKNHGPKDKNMILREAKVLQILHDEGYFK